MLLHLAGPLMRRFTASALVAGGSALMTAAALWLAMSRSLGADLYGAATILGLGIGLGYAALGTMAVEHRHGPKRRSPCPIIDA